MGQPKQPIRCRRLAVMPCLHLMTKALASKMMPPKIKRLIHFNKILTFNSQQHPDDQAFISPDQALVHSASSMGIRPNVSSTSDITSGFQSASATPTHPHALHQNIYQPHGTHANPTTTNGGYGRNGYNAMMTHHMNRFDLTQLGSGPTLSQPLQTVQGLG